MSDAAILAALRRMGFDKDEISVHGFRTMARTILDEVLGFRSDLYRTPACTRCQRPKWYCIYARRDELPEQFRSIGRDRLERMIAALI